MDDRYLSTYNSSLILCFVFCLRSVNKGLGMLNIQVEQTTSTPSNLTTDEKKEAADILITHRINLCSCSHTKDLFLALQTMHWGDVPVVGVALELNISSFL